MNVSSPAEAVVDLAAIRANCAVLQAKAGSAELMAVVKADAYGHGLVPCAQAARAGGATWLGVAQLAEALELRAAGDTGRILAWLTVPGQDLSPAIVAGIDLNASSPQALDQLVQAATEVGRTAKVHLKVDTGLGRNGAVDWAGLLQHAVRAQASGAIELVGGWTHLAWADAPQHPTTVAQLAAFAQAMTQAQRLGARFTLRHVANSAATLTTPSAQFDLVRPGIAVYGLSPIPEQATAAELGLTPAMSLSAQLALVKRVPADAGVSYAHTYRTQGPTSLGLVPLGYADGIPRAASNCGPVQVRGRRYAVAGRVCMDQFMLELGDASVAAGEPVHLFGSGAGGEPTAQDWAEATGTISYEIVTRVGPRVPRRYVGAVV